MFPSNRNCMKRITQDLKRTYNDQAENGKDIDLNPLRNVLYAFAKRNSTIGYCQGLNFVAGHLLRYLTEEEAFWALCCLIESILPIDYYPAMIGILVDQKVFAKLVKMNFVEVWNHLEKMNLDVSLLSLQWFICLFSYNLKSEVSDPIWDFLFLSGTKILFRAGIALVSLIKKNFLKCKEFRIIEFYFQRMHFSCQRKNHVHFQIQAHLYKL